MASDSGMILGSVFSRLWSDRKARKPNPPNYGTRKVSFMYRRMPRLRHGMRKLLQPLSAGARRFQACGMHPIKPRMCRGMLRSRSPNEYQWSQRCRSLPCVRRDLRRLRLRMRKASNGLLPGMRAVVPELC